MKRSLLLLNLIFLNLCVFAQLPNFQWADNISGTSGESGTAITTDGSGNVFTTGAFNGTTDFDPGTGTFNLTCLGWDDIFILKTNSSGAFLWVKHFGTSALESSTSIAADAFGNVYVTGRFVGTLDFDPGPAIYNLTTIGIEDQFILKLDANGNFIWAKQIGGTNAHAFGKSLALNAAGDVFTCGSFFNGAVDFDPGIATYTLASNGQGDDVFVSKLDAAGNFIWAVNFGTPNSDFAMALALDANSNIYTIGTFDGTADFDPGLSTYTLSSFSNFDMFISKLDGSGNFVWAKQIGDSNSFCFPKAIAVDAQNNIFATGIFTDHPDFDPGTGVYTLTSFTFSSDVFVLKLDVNGNFVWAKQIGGLNGTPSSHSIALDALSNCYITGGFTGTVDFDPSVLSNNIISTGQSDIFILKLDMNGNFTWIKKTGSTSDEVAFGIATDQAANIYLTGDYKGTVDFDPTNSIYNLTAAGANDMFIVKLGQPTLGIHESKAIDVIILFPNPVTDVLNIKLDTELNATAKFELYNLLGQLVLAEELHSKNSIINTKDLCAGVYVLNVITNEGIISKKIIKQ